MATAAKPSSLECPPTIKAPDCIQCVCRDYRKLFVTDEDMAAALGTELHIAQNMLNGNVYPDLEAMIRIQDALRRASIARPVLG